MRKSLSIFVVFVLLFVSCAKKEVKPVVNPGNLYVEGVELLKKKKYDKAIADFAKIRKSFPFDPIAIVAEVKQADAYFEKKGLCIGGGDVRRLRQAATPTTRMLPTRKSASPNADEKQSPSSSGIKRSR